MSDTCMNVASVRADVRAIAERHGRGIGIAVELPSGYRDRNAPGCDVPVGAAYYDAGAGRAVVEAMHRFPRGGVAPEPRMGFIEARPGRDPLASDASVPEGCMTADGLLDAMAGFGSAEGVWIRMFDGGSPDETDLGVQSVMEYPVQDEVGVGDDGTLTDSYGNAIPDGEDRVVYALLCPTDEEGQ